MRRVLCSRCFSLPSSSTRLVCLFSYSTYLLDNLSQIILYNCKVVTVETKRASIKLKNASWKDLKAIFALAGPYKWRIMLGLSFLGVSSSVFLLTPRILGKLIDEFDETRKSKPEDEDQTLRLARYFKENPIALGGVLLLGAAAIAARVYCMHTAGQLVVNDLRKKVFNAVLRQDIAFFDRNKIYTSPALCQVMFIVIPIIVGTFAVFGKLQRKYTLQMQEAVAGANQVATERLSSVRTVRMLVAERKEMAAYG
ncbi:unnamed protein product, partial [Strongylus vulgaris]